MKPHRQPSIAESPWMTAETCAAYMQFPSVKAFYNWLKTPEGLDLPYGKRGKRTLMFDRRIVDAYLSGLLPRSSSKKPQPRLVHGASVRESTTAR